MVASIRTLSSFYFNHKMLNIASKKCTPNKTHLKEVLDVSNHEVQDHKRVLLRCSRQHIALLGGQLSRNTSLQNPPSQPSQIARLANWILIYYEHGSTDSLVHTLD